MSTNTSWAMAACLSLATFFREVMWWVRIKALKMGRMAYLVLLRHVLDYWCCRVKSHLAIARSCYPGIEFTPPDLS